MAFKSPAVRARLAPRKGPRKRGPSSLSENAGGAVGGLAASRVEYSCRIVRVPVVAEAFGVAPHRPQLRIAAELDAGTADDVVERGRCAGTLVPQVADVVVRAQVAAIAASS